LTDISAATPVQRISRRATGTDTVTVACSLPNGFILQIYDVEIVESVLPNGRAIRENVSTLNLEAGQYALNGQKVDYAALAAGQLPDYRVIKGSAPDTGYALTPGIPRSFWERWLDQNKLNPLVKNRIVFASGTEARAADEAREYKDLRTGFQGLSQSGDYRVPSGRSIRKYSPTDNRVTPEQSELASEE
jgi:hypothetical protein